MGGITSPEAVVVVLHLADIYSQQHWKSVRWEMAPLL
jgi:hypothetical protein